MTNVTYCVSYRKALTEAPISDLDVENSKSSSIMVADWTKKAMKKHLSRHKSDRIKVDISVHVAGEQLSGMTGSLMYMVRRNNVTCAFRMGNGFIIMNALLKHHAPLSTGSRGLPGPHI